MRVFTAGIHQFNQRLGYFAADRAVSDHANHTCEVRRRNGTRSDVLAFGIQQSCEVAHHPVRGRFRVAGQFRSSLEIVGERTKIGKLSGIGGGQPVLFDEPILAGVGQFRHLGAYAVNPFLRNLQRHEVWLREVAILLLALFGTLRERTLPRIAPAACLLRDLFAALEQRRLTIRLVVYTFLYGAKRVQVFNFCLRAKSIGTDRANRDVRFAAQRTLFHFAIADADIGEDRAQAGQVGAGVVGGMNIGREIGDDLHQRHAGAVQIDAGAVAGGMEKLTGVFFEVYAQDMDTFRDAIDFDIEVAFSADRVLVFADLVAFGQIGIEVVFAIEAGVRVDLAVQGE